MLATCLIDSRIQTRGWKCDKVASKTRIEAVLRWEEGGPFPALRLDPMCDGIGHRTKRNSKTRCELLKSHYIKTFSTVIIQ